MMGKTIRFISITFIFLSFYGFYLSHADTEKAQQSSLTKQNDSEQTSELKDSTSSNITVIEINGGINPGSLDYIRDGLEEAETTSSDALVILLDTPGGLLSSTKDIVKLILNAPLPVIVYVSPSGASATSAGVFITLAGNIAAMAPGTSIGAAHPVSLGPSRKQDPKEKEEKKETSKKDEKKESKEEEETPSTSRSQEEIMNEKIENFTSSFIKSIAEQRGKNVEWAIDAVRKSDSITANEALEKNVIDLISPNLQDLLTQIDGKEVLVQHKEWTLNTKSATITKIEMNPKQKLIDLLSTPDIAFLLLSLGSLGLLLEFYNPGLIFPGVAGLVCLLLGFVSFQILPFNYAGLALLFIGIGLFVTEIYVTSFGLLTVGGLITFGLGALLLFDTPESDLRVGLDVVLAITATIGSFFVFVIYKVVKTRNLQPQGGIEGIIGEVGEAVSDIGGSGKIYVVGEYWDAQSDEPINKGDKIKVVESLKGFKLKVKRIEN